MTDEEIEKIAKKVLELQKAEGVKTTQSLLTFLSRSTTKIS